MKYNFKRLIAVFMLFVLLIPNTTATTNHHQLVTINQDNVKIVANLSFLGDFANALYDNGVEITNMIDANQDPHFYEPGPNELIAMSEADVILALGSIEFDRWLTDYIEDSGDQSLQNKLETVANPDEFERIDPLTGVKNPHFWLDPSNAKIMVNNTADILLERGLIDSSTVFGNKPNYMNQLDELLDEIETLRPQFEGTKVIVDHPSFLYLLDLLGIDRRGVLEEREGEEPSPLHVQEIRELMDEEGIELIIASSIQAGDDIEQLARDTGASIAYLTPLTGIEGAEDYISMIEYNLEALQNPTEPEGSAGFLDLNIYSIILGVVVLAKIKTLKKISRYHS